MNTLPTESESRILEKLSKAGYFHFALLVLLIFIASLVLFASKDGAPIQVAVLGGLICLTGISTINLQYFQKCPRCNTRMSRVHAACGSCGLEYYSRKADQPGTGE